ncbi:hydroxymyristoyl-ACP dehydratase [Gramella sp. GC03-9]|uniref:Hydroxymyristoyl-ACP dehydratase n=1 Tax=Christiangramia oceanisediminis TaxID=2920386 RepID=A0A9X2KYJ4_9FLAO|nr:FabA/FabZ family ACP-dehydratase [Gramella oceanisediminis]MCP9200416.1 hydroxymyristoyl-ACP dehydratase [Gramella oceanisediminis]
MHTNIISQLPYSSPFLFVDTISNLDENGVTGEYTFSPDLEFYKGHFQDAPVTPGVILTECMAQIGLVCLGIHLVNTENIKLNDPLIALTSSNVEYLLPVYPGERVKVISVKKYFRFNKLKCEVKMFNSKDEQVCRGTLAGIVYEKSKSRRHE